MENAIPSDLSNNESNPSNNNNTNTNPNTSTQTTNNQTLQNSPAPSQRTNSIDPSKIYPIMSSAPLQPNEKANQASPQEIPTANVGNKSLSVFVIGLFVGAIEVFGRWGLNKLCPLTDFKCTFSFLSNYGLFLMFAISISMGAVMLLKLTNLNKTISFLIALGSYALASQINYFLVIQFNIQTKEIIIFNILGIPISGILYWAFYQGVKTKNLA